MLTPDGTETRLGLGDGKMHDRDGPSGYDSLPGRDASLWMDTTERTDYAALDGDRRVETAVVGGGIAGVTAALHCAEAGREVALLESGRVVEGVTGRTTAKITAQHGFVYDDLLEAHGEEVARQYAAANSAAVEEVAARVEAHDIDCDFERTPAYTYAEATPDQRAKTKREAGVAAGLGLPAEYVSDLPLPDDAPGAVKFENQAQFHPRKYLLELVAQIPEQSNDERETESAVYERTKVTNIEDGTPCRVETERGTATAENVVVATHFPIEDPALYFARLYPKRSYVLAVRLAESGEVPSGMFYRDAQPYFSVRPHPTADGPVVLVGGQNHKTGQGGSTADRYRRLESQARDHFDVESIEYRWSTQDYVSVDRLPMVGRLGPRTENVFVATGFGGWGMTNGTAAGMLLADLAREKTASETDRSKMDQSEMNRSETRDWVEAFDPTRFTPEASGKEFLTENVNVGTKFVGDWTKAALSHETELAPGEGEIVRRGGDVLAVARDDDGELHVESAVCPHLKCLVRWNDAESTWDCPCHGSRFSIDGDVLDGPAVSDLPERRE